MTWGKVIGMTRSEHWEEVKTRCNQIGQDFGGRVKTKLKIPTCFSRSELATSYVREYRVWEFSNKISGCSWKGRQNRE